MGSRFLLSDRSVRPNFFAPILSVSELAGRFAGLGKKPIPGSGKSATRQPQPVPQPARILIIEDDPGSLELYELLFGACGYQALLARDGREGLALARREHPDLIICDVMLPKLGGVELLKDLKADKLLRHIPIIAVTILADLDDRQRLLAAGFDGYIPKPIEVEVFVEQIEKFLS